MTRLLAAAVLLGLVVSSAALAARGDPQKRIEPADQRRAKAMLLLKSDLPATFKATPPSPDSGGDAYCKAVDESDLTLTGEAASKDFEAGIVFVSSNSQVYETVADANASWRRGTSAAGFRCIRQVFKQELKSPGATLTRIPFPKVAPRVFAFRLKAREQGIQISLDFVVMQRSRAHVGLGTGAALAPFPKGETVRLARILSGRMTKAMRGA